MTLIPRAEALARQFHAGQTDMGNHITKQINVLRYAPARAVLERALDEGRTAVAVQDLVPVNDAADRKA